MRGRLEDALKEYKKVIEQNRTYADAYYNVAKIYEEKGMRADAENYYSQYNKVKVSKQDATGIGRKMIKGQETLPGDYVE
jgi:tetratricopeptide (TPR) repeat protein